MEPVPLEGTYRGPMTVDLCTACRGFWFDAGEQFRLTPAATLVLVRRVEASRDQPRQRMGSRFRCPRCRLPLGVTYDLVRDDKYHYFRCPDRHGIFMPFFEFLRSQGLVRGLTPCGKSTRLQRWVDHARAAARPSIQTQSKCASCGSSLSIVDVDRWRRAQPDADARAASTVSGAPARSAGGDCRQLLGRSRTDG